MHPVQQSAPQFAAEATRKPRLAPRILLSVCAVVILFSSTMRAGLAGEYVYFHFLRGITSFQVAQKSIHVILFVIFGWVCWQLLAPRSRGSRFAITMLGSLIMGAASETLQIFTHRDPTVADALLNLCSGTVGAVIASALQSDEKSAAEIVQRKEAPGRLGKFGPPSDC